MYTIIIGDGLTEDFLSPEVQYIAGKSSVGQYEIDRLMGKGRHFGQGPLPAFLRQATSARQNGASIGLLFLRNTYEFDEAGEDEISSNSSALDFTEPFREISAETYVVESHPGLVPWQQILEGIQQLTGGSSHHLQEDKPEVRFLIVGCHTEKRIFTIATFFRNVLSYHCVAVSSHLIGSSAQEAHFATLRHTFPSNGIKVMLDLEETAKYAGIAPAPFVSFGLKPCSIEPIEARKELDEERRRIIELLCMHWSKTHLRPLQGGFSGSLLFLADGWKIEARTEPMVLKIDSFLQMRREIDGYYQVKDFLGKHVPTFGYPVALGDAIGVGMELAAMEGQPETLQDSFEAAEGEETLGIFIQRLDKALHIISEKLHKNTRQSSWVTPYRQFTLHTDQQLVWLEENVSFIMEYLAADKRANVMIDSDILPKILKLIASNEDSIESEICIAHGDINYQNIICDQGDNIWFIDWTHCGLKPLELDFAKLENDVKFVMSKHFDTEDLSRLKTFEEYLLSHRIPAEDRNLPDSLKFAKWDLRYRKILLAVRRIREVCFALKRDEDWLVYRIALLSNALHTLSFDKRRGRGECELPQLTHAVMSAQKLLLDLVSDDFHLKIRGERPSSYPPRYRVSIDEASWALKCSEYSPPYHVDPSVLENDYIQKTSGWADPESFDNLPPDRRPSGYKHKDDEGRPLHPRGRTGIAGRGLLGRWGPNLAVSAIVLREDPKSGQFEILLGTKERDHALTLPKGFVKPSEEPKEAMRRVLEQDCGWLPHIEDGESIFEGYSYDPRQTDHAWVEICVFLLHYETDAVPPLFRAGGEFEEVTWRPLDPKTINSVRHGQAHFIRDVIKLLQKKGRLDIERANVMLSETG
jgi:ADP-ribose pyrophosphatase